MARIIKKELMKVFRNIGKDVDRAKIIALNRAAKTALTRTMRFMREKYNIKASILKRLFTIMKATKNSPVVLIHGFKQPIAFFMDQGSTRLFSVRQTKKGVSFTRKRGQRERIDSAFIATMRSGHVGVFTRTGEYNDQGEEKIKQLFALDPAKLLVPESTNTEVINYMNTIFRTRLRLEFERALEHGK